MSSAVVSIYKVTMGGLVLLDVDDLLWGDPQDILKIIPDFAGVEKVLFVGGVARTYERGGRMHTMEFSRVRIHDTVQDALKFQLMHPSELPAGGQDVTIEMDDYLGSRTLYKASIVSAPIFTLHQLSITAYTIVGGALTGNITSEITIRDQDNDAVLDQTGDVMEQQH